MEEILHLGCIKPCKYWDINWCRISEPSTVLSQLSPNFGASNMEGTTWNFEVCSFNMHLLKKPWVASWISVFFHCFKLQCEFEIRGPRTPSPVHLKNHPVHNLVRDLVGNKNYFVSQWMDGVSDLISFKIFQKKSTNKNPGGGGHQKPYASHVPVAQWQAELLPQSGFLWDHGVRGAKLEEL